MKRSRFSEEQIIGIVREADGESTVKAVCANHNISEATYYAWTRKYGGMDVKAARRASAGRQFIAYAVQDWMKDQEIETLYIKPGSRWEQAYIESFHDKLRDEFLNREIFGALREAQVVLEAWRCEYNEERPHSSLGYQTPSEFAASCEIALRPRASAPFRRPNGNNQPMAELSF
ncbi:MAG: integrase core domain-containing protein [Verrucomicrobiota bacterium]